MMKLKLLWLALVGMFYIAQGQTFKIYMEFLNGNLIFKWTNVSTARNDVIITRDSQGIGWIQVDDDQYTVEDVMQYKSVKIQVREYNDTKSVHNGYADYFQTYNVNKVESIQGEARNISWTIDIFPATGDYKVFHNGTNGLYLQINPINLGNKTDTPRKMVLEISNITLADAGHYMGGPSLIDTKTRGEDAVLIVYAKPLKPNITGVLNVKAGEYATLTCESRSTSAPDYYKFSPLSYSWFVNTREQRKMGQIYRFIVSKDVKNNRYSCQAKESNRSEETLKSDRSEEIQINPLYGPESVTVTKKPPNDELSIQDGKTFDPYTCSADCNPPCTVQWKFKDPSGGFYMATSPGKSTVTLTEQKANRTSMAGIRCEVNGTEGKKVSDIKLNIQYLLEPRVFISGIPHISYTLNESDPLRVTCMVEGNPTPEVTVGKLTGEKNSGKNQLNFTLSRKAQCSDTGNYSCEGKSANFSSKYQSFSINVLCDPHLDESGLFKPKYGSMSGPDIFLVVAVPVIAYPSPYKSKITWSSVTSQSTSIEVSQRDNVIYKHWINSTIPIPNPKSFGNHTLMYNKKSIVNITINAEDKPQPPLNFTRDTGYINLTWVSNFNGGPEQFFILSQKQGSSWTQVDNLTDPGEGSMGYYNIGPLIPGQQYWYRLESCNRINCSYSPKMLNFIVPALPTSSSQSEDNTMMIAIGSSLAVLVCIVIVAVVMTKYFLRKKSAQKHKSEERNSGSLEPDNAQPDVVVYAAVDKSVLMKNRQQDDVMKSDVIKDTNVENDAVYSEVIKPSKRQKKTNKKNGQKNGEKKELIGKKEEAGGSNRDENTREVNEDGLVYIDVEFTNKGFESDKKGKAVVHGEEERTEYTFVDFTKKAPPMEEPQDDAE